MQQSHAVNVPWLSPSMQWKVSLYFWSRGWDLGLGLSKFKRGPRLSSTTRLLYEYTYKVKNYVRVNSLGKTRNFTFWLLETRFDWKKTRQIEIHVMEHGERNPVLGRKNLWWNEISVFRKWKKERRVIRHTFPPPHSHRATPLSSYLALSRHAGRVILHTHTHTRTLTAVVWSRVAWNRLAPPTRPRQSLTSSGIRAFDVSH